MLLDPSKNDKADKATRADGAKPLVGETIDSAAEAKKAAANLPSVDPWLQNRELSWLTFDERVLDQGADETVPLLERLQFVSIFSSNLQEFFMVRVGSLTDLMLLKKEVIDTKSGMTPLQQLAAIYMRCHELYPLQERIFADVEAQLAQNGVVRLGFDELSDDERGFLDDHLDTAVLPFLSPQIINARHPFPHLENGAMYIIVRLTEESDKPKDEMTKEERKAEKEARKKAKNLGAEGVTLGLIPLPAKARRVIKLPGEGFRYILLEDALEAVAGRVFSMYNLKHTNIICVTRNADLDATEGADEREEDYREHMKKILKRRGRLAPVRLESRHKLSKTVGGFLMNRLELRPSQLFCTSVPMDMGYAFALPSMVDDDIRSALTSPPFAPAWPGAIKRGVRITDQVQQRELLLSYPYESMDPFVQLLREAAEDPATVSIKITLYRLAGSSHLAEALIAAAEAGIEVTALFELRARFDESNNIEWSQRFEEAGAKVIYGFHDYKVHSKICCITRSTETGLQYITQLGTGNYNEKTAKLYTDFSFITTDAGIGADATEFFRNMGLENTSREYTRLWVAPLQIKQNVLAGIDEQIALANEGKPCGLFFKTNSITDKEIIDKLVEASRANVPVTMLVRGISCLVPGVSGLTDNIRIVSIVGRLLEHSRIYGFGPHADMRLYLSSADLMTRNMDKRIEIAWPMENETLRRQIVDYIDTCLSDTAKLRELLPDRTYTPLRAGVAEGATPFNSQESLIKTARDASDRAAEAEEAEGGAFNHLRMQAEGAARDAGASDLEEVFREALKHEVPSEDVRAIAAAAMAAFEAVRASDAGAAGAAPAASAPAASAPVASAPAASAPAAADTAAAADKPAANPTIVEQPKKRGLFGFRKK